MFCLLVLRSPKYSNNTKKTTTKQRKLKKKKTKKKKKNDGTTAYGTQLATINSEDDYDSVVAVATTLDSSMSFDGYAWIGLNDVVTEGSYVWSYTGNIYNGSDDEYGNLAPPLTSDGTYWATSEPNGGKNENCVIYYKTSSREGYADVDCSRGDIKSFVCDLDYLTYETDKYIGVWGVYDWLTWYEANDYCYDKFGTSLASIHSDTDNANAYNSIYKLNEAMGETKVKYAWTGAYDVTQTTHLWIDGTDSTTFRDFYDDIYGWWYDCGDMRGWSDNSGPEWYSWTCDKGSAGFICNRPNVFEKYSNDHYHGLRAVKYAESYDDANDVCEQTYGTHLAMIRTNTEASEISQVYDDLSASGAGTVWIGLNDMNSEGTYKWEDGESFSSTSYSTWWPGQPNNWNDQDCIGAFSSSANGYKWADYDCNDNPLWGMICEVSYTDVEYYKYIGVYTNGDYVTWDEANAYCSYKYGTELATITSSDDDSNAYWLIYKYFQTSAWIGLNDWVFADGTSYVDFSNGWIWGSVNSGDCVNMDSDDTYYWNGIDCDTQLNAFVCNNDYNTYVSSSSGYVGINTRGSGSSITWSDANTYCINNFGTTLASIHDSDDASAIEDIMTYLSLDEGGNTFGAWIGLYEPSNNNWQWNDGSDYDFSDWGSNEPNGDGDCAHFRYWGYENSLNSWNDLNCVRSGVYGFICNYYVGANKDSDDNDWSAKTNGNGDGTDNDNGGVDKSSGTGNDSNDGEMNTDVMIVIVGVLAGLVFLIGCIYWTHRKNKKLNAFVDVVNITDSGNEKYNAPDVREPYTNDNPITDGKVY